MVRYKNRYFITEVEVKGQPSHAPLSISQNRIHGHILNKIQKIHGDFGLAAVTTGFRVKYCNPYTKIVLIRSRHGPHRFVATILPLIKRIDDINLQFHILHIGSTMMKSFKFIRNHQLATLEKYWNQMKTDSDRAQFKEALMSISVNKG